MKDKEGYILDDRHEILNLYKSQCAFCRHFKDDYTCNSFPKGIPDKLLKGAIKHDSHIPSQKGHELFSKKKEFDSFNI